MILYWSPRGEFYFSLRCRLHGIICTAGGYSDLCSETLYHRRCYNQDRGMNPCHPRVEEKSSSLTLSAATMQTTMLSFRQKRILTSWCKIHFQNTVLSWQKAGIAWPWTHLQFLTSSGDVLTAVHLCSTGKKRSNKNVLQIQYNLDKWLCPFSSSLSSVFPECPPALSGSCYVRQCATAAQESGLTDLVVTQSNRGRCV